MGDLNEWSMHGGCLREFCAIHLMAPCGPSFHARRPIAELDRIMVTPDLAILASGTHVSPLSLRASDHLPIWADLRRSEARQELPPRPERPTIATRIRSQIDKRRGKSSSSL
jgi:endonuclease/exonuclease/phosphatase family metal-dependent hydrolase